MRLSSKRIRQAVDRGIDVAHDEATAAIDAAARHLAHGADHHASRSTDAVDEAFAHLPKVDVTLTRRGSRRRGWRPALLVLVTGVVAFVAVRRLMRVRASASPPPSPEVAPAERSNPSRAGTEHRGTGATEAEPVGVGSTPSVTFSVKARPGNDGWDVSGSDGAPVGEPVRTQADGIQVATKLAEEAGGGDVVVHGLDGEPRETRRVPAPSTT